MKSGCSGALKLDGFGLNCKANKCSDAGTEDLGLLTIDETSPCFSVGDTGSTRPGLMPPQEKTRKPHRQGRSFARYLNLTDMSEGFSKSLVLKIA